MKKLFLFITLLSVINLCGTTQSFNTSYKEIESLIDSELYELAIEKGKTLLDSVHNNMGENCDEYSNLLFLISDCYDNINNYDEAIRLGTKAAEIYKENHEIPDSTYASLVDGLARYYSHSGNYSKAVKLGTEAMEIAKIVLGKEHEDFAISLNNLAIYNSYIGNYIEAIKLGKEAMEIAKKVLGTEHPGYLFTIANLAGFQSYLGNYPEAIRLSTEALEIRKKILGTEHPSYALSLSNLAVDYSHMGNYAEAVRSCSEAIEIYKRVLGEEHPYYALSLANLANYYSYLGDYSKAIIIGSEAMEIRKNVLGVDHPDYALSLNNIATYLILLGNYSEAIKLSTEAMNILKNKFGVDHPDYALTLSHISRCYSELGNYTEAVRLGTEAMEIQKRVLGAYHPDYAISLSNLSSYYSRMGFNSKSVMIENEAKEIYKKVLGISHPRYAQSLTNLAVYNSNLGNQHTALEYLKESVNVTVNHLINQLGTLTAKERESYWALKSYDVTNNYISFVIADGVFSGETIGDLYDKSALFAKGLLLNADIELSKLIAESNDNVLIEKYQLLRQDKLILDKLYETPIDQRTQNADSLKQEMERLNRDLLVEVKEYGDCMRNQTINWHDVQNVLNDNGIAIEFLNFNDNDKKIEVYVALTLKKGYSTPKLIPLFDNRQLAACTNMDSISLYNLVWKPLESELLGVEDIYFSPAGALHQLPIEYVTMDDGNLICDHYSLYRLSSTRQLVSRNDHTLDKQKTATLYGGLDYDASAEQLSFANQGFQAKTVLPYYSNLMATRALIDSTLYRSGCEYLEGSRLEVDSVMRELQAKGISVTTYTGANGTEESFKALSEHAPSVLLVSTHGFYWAESVAEKRKVLENIRFLQQEGNQATTTEDKALTRSGLMMAGCNRSLKGITSNDDLEDGILTAKEISQLDLRGLDLVVLSACQTALGDLGGSEGVFGLQRAFKKAGAQTILMSLWKVEDWTTQLLIVEFYKNYLAGKSKQESLRKAQQYLRDYQDENGNKLFDDSHYWAGFVLLDALD